MKIHDFEIVVYDDELREEYKDITGECDKEELFIGNNELYAVYIPPPISNLEKNSELVAVFFGSELIYLNYKYKIFMVGRRELKVKTE